MVSITSVVLKLSIVSDAQRYKVQKQETVVRELLEQAAYSSTTASK